jgi:hypothetical protein
MGEPSNKVGAMQKNRAPGVACERLFVGFQSGPQNGNDLASSCSEPANGPENTLAWGCE